MIRGRALAAQRADPVNAPFEHHIAQVQREAPLELGPCRGTVTRVLPLDELPKLLEPRLPVSLLLVGVLEAGAFPRLQEIFLDLPKTREPSGPKLEVTAHALVHDVPERQCGLRPGGDFHAVAEFKFQRTTAVVFNRRGAEPEFLSGRGARRLARPLG